MTHETLELWRARSLREFLDAISRKKRVLGAMSAWHRFHVSTALPLAHGVCLSVMIEEEEGVTAIVVLSLRAAFDEEEALAAWQGSRWFFTTWRRMAHDGQLARAFDEFLNRMDADLERLPERMAEVRRNTRDDVARLDSLVESVRLSTSPQEVEDAGASLRAAVVVARERAEKLLWYRFFEEMRGYLAHGDGDGDEGAGGP